uniref:Uncharacterized protein n=1 Tax=Hyaloperonospora arabidopsidis (strain Emoy2) TaxID=559515 RepID=M4BXQ7_HYAAE
MNPGLFTARIWSSQSRMRFSFSLQSLRVSRRSIVQRYTSQEGLIPKISCRSTWPVVGQYTGYQ